MILITAAKDTDFIYPIHDAMFFRSITGLESCVFDYLENFQAEIITNNEVRIRPGVGMIQGRIFEVVPDTYDSVTIENGTQGENRIDLIAARFEADEETNTQEATWRVIKGTPVAGDPTAPTCIEGDIDAGDTIAEIPLAEVELEGINITAVRMVYPALASNLEASKISDTTAEKYKALGFVEAEYAGGAIDKILNFIADSNLAITYTTDDGWTVKKYANGEAECWISTGSISIPSTAFIAWGGMYIVDAADGFQGIDYPSGLFIEPPKEWANPHFGNSTASVALWPGLNNTSEHSYGYCYVRGTKSNATVSIDIYAKGRWKE